MESRMEKYQTNNTSSRASKNKRLYEEIGNMNIDFVDIDVNNAIEFKTNNQTKTRAEYQRQKEFEILRPTRKERSIVEEINEKEETKEKSYDINEILKLARENKLFDHEDEKKRLLNTEYNILTKLDIDKISQNKEYSKDSLKELIDNIYEAENNKKKNKEIDKELFDDLKEKDIEISEDLSLKVLDKNKEPKTEPKKQEKDVTILNDTKEEKIATLVETTQKEIDKMQKEKDEEDENFDLDDSKFNVGAIIITILVLSILAVVGYFLYKYFSA